MSNPKSERKRLNKIETCYIDNNFETMTCSELARDLKLPVALVRSRYNKMVEQKKKREEDIKKAKPITSGDLLARKDKRGTVTMTPESAMLSDETRKTHNAKKKTRLDRHIHKINPDK